MHQCHEGISAARVRTIAPEAMLVRPTEEVVLPAAVGAGVVAEVGAEVLFPLAGAAVGAEVALATLAVAMVFAVGAVTPVMFSAVITAATAVLNWAAVIDPAAVSAAAATAAPAVAVNAMVRLARREDAVQSHEEPVA